MATHHFIQGKDLRFDPKFDPLDRTQFLVFVDVDYYLDIAYWISLGLPILLVTHIPDKLSCESAGRRYHTEGDFVITHVDGGEMQYRHKVWDYSNDILVTDIGHKTYIASVDSKRLYMDLHVTCILPLAQVSYFLGRFLCDNRLSRRQYHQPNGLSINTFSDGVRVWISLIEPGKHTSIDLPLSVFEALTVIARRRKHLATGKITPYDVGQLFKQQNLQEADTKVDIILLQDILDRYDNFTMPIPLGKHTDAKAWTPPKHPPDNYRAVDDLMQEPAPYGRTICPPLVEHPDMVPSNTDANHHYAMRERVIKPQNKTVPPRMHRRLAEEFCRRLVPHTFMHMLTPEDRDYVQSQQTKPAQKRRLENSLNTAWTYTPAFIVKAFQKKETYAKAGAPRIISQVPDVHTLNLSMFTYPFKKEFLQQTKWYSPGSHPRDIDARVVEVCHGEGYVALTDFTKFDGHISQWLSINVVKQAYLRAYEPKYHDSFHTIFDKEFGATMYLGDVKYIIEAQRLSGSPQTTDSNTTTIVTGKQIGRAHV